MSGFLRLALIVSAILLFVYMIKKIRQSKVKIEYTIFWLGFSVVLIVMGVFPQLFYVISDFIGFQSPVNLLFLMIIFVLIVKNFYTTIEISQLENKVDNLTQQIEINQKDERDFYKENRSK